MLLGRGNRLVAHVISLDARDILVPLSILRQDSSAWNERQLSVQKHRSGTLSSNFYLPYRYQLRLPFDSAAGAVSVWIHKQKKRFYALGVEPEAGEISGLADALDSQTRVNDDDEAPSTLLESGTEEETLSIVNDATGEEIS